MSKSTNEQEVKQDNHSEKNTLDRLVKKGFMPEVFGANLQMKYTNIMGGISIETALNYMLAETKKIKRGSLEAVENMLVIQAVNLNAIFNTLANNASNTEFVPHFEMLLRLAFKAQAQSRATLETLANLKNPPQVAFVKQANIGHNQQVNNNVSLESASRAKELKNQQNQLLEEQHGEWVDIGTQSQTIKADKELETVGKVYRAENT